TIARAIALEQDPEKKAELQAQLEFYHLERARRISANNATRIAVLQPRIDRLEDIITDLQTPCLLPPLSEFREKTGVERSDPPPGEEDDEEPAPVAVAGNVAGGGMPSDPIQTMVPFARHEGPFADLYWPVITSSPNALVVSHRTQGGALVGREGRRFLADRNGGLRFHVGIDVFCSEGEEVVACADGRVVAFYKFYRTNSGEQSYALLLDHGDLVVNYGEVKGDGPNRYGWSIGSHVKGGQKIARV